MSSSIATQPRGSASPSSRSTRRSTAPSVNGSSLVYTQRNQYRVVIEVPPSRQRDPRDLSGIYVTNATGGQVPLQAVAHIERQSMPLIVNHQGVVPSVTITYNVAPGATLDAATKVIQNSIDDMHLPGGLHTGFAGDAADFKKVAAGMATLILAALLSVYIILGVLYESLIHPITIISTLPSAGLARYFRWNYMTRNSPSSPSSAYCC